jgi:branched-chain amino acid aminotransferase
MQLVSEEMPVALRSVKEDEILTAREMLIMGTTFDCVAIVNYEGKVVGSGCPGPVATRILELLKQDLLDNGTPFPLSAGP